MSGWQDRVIPEPNSGCWLWEGAQTTGGYGLVGRNGKLVYVHRLAWETTHGPIPKGLDVCHRCDVPACVNVGHLFLGTARDNALDMVTKWAAVLRTGCFNRDNSNWRGHIYSTTQTPGSLTASDSADNAT